MQENEETAEVPADDEEETAELDPAVKAAAKVEKKAPAKPARVLPSQEEIAAWAAGEELPSLENLFNVLNTKLFDVMMMQVRKEELLPQHWQVISRLKPPPDAAFDGLAEVARLRERYRDPALAEARTGALKIAWQELRGKRPALWTASDLFSALRRIIDKKRKPGFHHLLSAIRDVWSDLDLPHGKEQLEVLWACLSFIRTKTKK